MRIAYIDNKLFDKMNSKILTDKEILTYSLHMLEYLELYDYLKEIKIIDEKCDSFGSYNFRDKIMKINTYMNILDTKMENNVQPIKLNEPLMINMSLLNSVIHEFIHVMQNYIISETDWSMAPMLKNQIDWVYNNDNPDQYNGYYTHFTFEREALIDSIENILFILENYFNDPGVFNYYLNSLKYYLTIGYTEHGSYPVYALYNNLFQVDCIPTISGIDDYNTMKYGFYVPYSTVREYKENDEKILSKINLHQ